MIGDVQRVVSDSPVTLKESQVIVVSNKISIGLTGTHLFQYPFLAHFEDPRRSYENCGVASAECGTPKLNHGFTVFLWIFEIAVECLDAAVECGFQLREIANQYDQVRTSRVGMIG